MLSNIDELKSLLALKSLCGVGNRGALKLLQQFGSATAIFEATKTQLQEAGVKPAIIQQIDAPDFASVMTYLRWAEQSHCQIIPLGSAHYPPLLAQINNPPILLFTLGNAELLTSPQVAVVGSRNPTSQGTANTQALCQSLCEQGITITSGLALGIDGEAHRAALLANGYTIAVTGTGLNRVYPAHHRQLAHQIADQGLLVSENFPDDYHQPGCFPQRNRIIAGLSLGTLVVEAAFKSGTLITARHAMEEGREVFAIPGSIHNPLAKGCHRLIKQGAKLTETIEDIIEDLPSFNTGMLDRSASLPKSPLDAATEEFLKHIDYELTPLDTIIQRSQLTVEAVTNKLLLLELEGWVINSVGGYIRQ